MYKEEGCFPSSLMLYQSTFNAAPGISLLSLSPADWSNTLFLALPILFIEVNLGGKIQMQFDSLDYSPQ